MFDIDPFTSYTDYTTLHKKWYFRGSLGLLEIKFATNSYSMTLSPSYKLLFWVSRVVLWLSLEDIIWNNCKKYQMALRNGVRGFGMWYMDSGWWFKNLVDLRSAQFRLYSGKNEISNFENFTSSKYKMTKMLPTHRLWSVGVYVGAIFETQSLSMSISSIFLRGIPHCDYFINAFGQKRPQFKIRKLYFFRIKFEYCHFSGS